MKNNPELLNSIGEFVRDKGLEQEDVILALEQALLEAARTRYGNCDLEVSIDPDSGDIKLYHNYVVDEKPQKVSQISLEEAKLINPDVKLGEMVKKQLPFGDFSRIGIQLARNALEKKTEEIRRADEYSEFQDKVGEIVNGFVKQSYANGDLLVGLGRGLGMLYAQELLPKEKEGTRYKPGDTIKAYIKDVRNIPEMTKSGAYQIVLSRTNPQFLVKLFETEVPEISSGAVEIKAVARVPGRRAKVAVISHDPSVDAVGACIGAKGSRIAPITMELKGERIDVVHWDEDEVTFVVNALKPAQAKEAIKIGNNIIVIVDEDDKQEAMGKYGLNIALAAELTGARLSILTKAEEKARSIELQKFLELALEIDEDMASVLVSNGYETIQDLNNIEAETLAEIEGFDIELAEALKERAQEHTREFAKFVSNHKDLDKALLSIPSLRTVHIKALYESGIKTFESLAALKPEELLEKLAVFNLSPLSAQKMVSYASKRLLDKDKNKGGRRRFNDEKGGSPFDRRSRSFARTHQDRMPRTGGGNSGGFRRHRDEDK